MQATNNNFTDSLNKLNLFNRADIPNIAPPKKNNQWYSVASNNKNNHLDIHLYGVIGGNKINIQNLLDEFSNKPDLKTIDVYISSLGGTFNDGLPIYNTLRQHKAHVTTINMGYAVSMGSYIMLAGDKIKMAQNALQMIHSPLTVIWGYANARELLKEADVLDKHEATLIPRYAQKMGLSSHKVKELLQNETWYTADEALEAGLIDEIINAVDLDDIEEKMARGDSRSAVGLSRNKESEFQNLLSGLKLKR